jgi:very-short-patch-repair endonuclease
MQTGAEARVHALAGRQLGVLTLSQCEALGFTEKQVLARVAQGAWRRIRAGVYHAGAGPPSEGALELAELLAAGPEAALSHWSAARHWGLAVPRDRRVHLMVPATKTLQRRSGVKIWRSRDLCEGDLIQRGPYRLTRIGRTVLDLSAVLEDRWLRACVDSAVRLRRSNLRWISQVAKKLGPGRRGARRLRELVAEYEGDDEVTDSVLESFAMELGLATGRKPRLHQVVTRGEEFLAEVDLAWPEVRLCVELDGWAHHGSREAFERDRERDRALFGAGWSVLRFTWRDVAENRDAAIRQLQEAFARSAAVYQGSRSKKFGVSSD